MHKKNGFEFQGSHFVIRKHVFSLLLFVGWSLGFAFPKRFVELEKALL
jgi:hypothetical protein